MAVYQIDPLQDPRWAEFLQRHPRASAFHTPGWLEALRRTYGYQPVVFTTSAPDQELRNGMVFCRIDSFLTGRRLVSLPFADHCEPLVESPEDVKEIFAFLERASPKASWRCVEMRARSSDWPSGTGFASSETFCFHSLDLHPDAQELLRAFHKDSIQRKILRAEREGLTHEEGRSEALLDKFYRLLLLTRRRHQLPPQPHDWFCNLIACLGEVLKIRVTSRDSQPIASIITLRCKHTLIYKYGCSDSRFHNLGGMAFLLWKAIREAKDQGLQELDLGRSDCDNSGLIIFKDHWGAARSILTYVRYPTCISQPATERYRMQVAKRVFAHIPDGFLTAAGKLLYRHLG